MGYAVMLTGVGPARALAQRVSHVAYLATRNEDTVQVCPFPDMASRLSARGVHHSVLTHGGDAYVSIHLPALPRGYSASAPRGVMFPLDVDGAGEEAARSAFVAWCCEHATRA